ncbi:hypothetical protein QR680_001371 [Steinernema hermaphroditum]|uniref:C2 domain-containing protein n=1 Tax=Steinernema hermaphroditum TaxID=289476 RepID=A0AA39LFY1_9BILA|nr:hypothetical protein QR680_001371 [Steinernema hermaphroditum]
MVARPTVERWNRGQLEDEYHKLYKQNLDIKKRNNELEKMVKQLNGRIRRTVGDGALSPQTKADQDGELFELQRENHLLKQKLKSLKHQLLVYTRPGARAPMINSMTSRTSARPSVRPSVPTGRPSSTQSMRKSSVEHQDPNEKSDPSSKQIMVKQATGSKEKKGTTDSKPVMAADKSLVIKLNRELKARMTEVTELTFKLRSAQEKFQKLREEYDSCVMELESTRHRLSLLTESDRGSRAEEAPRPEEGSIVRKELEMVREENRLLRETNDRLVSKALDVEGYRGADEEEVKTLQMRISEMETQLMDAEAERKGLSSHKRELEREKQRLNKKVTRLSQQIEAMRSERIPVMQRQASDGDDLLEREATPLTTKKRNLNDVIGPLGKLFEDVTLMMETRASSALSSDEKSELSSTRYQKMYKELYEELEKVRNMLLIQHRINQQQSEEIILMTTATDTYKQEYERKLGYLAKELKKRKQRIIFLEDQLKSIAYGKDLRSLNTESIADLSLSEDRPNEIELHFSKLTVNSENSSVFSSLRPQLFISVEFFDFELQTTEVFPGPEVLLDFSTIYDVIVSNLFLHYVETDGITVELYEARANTYSLCGCGVIKLRSLLSLKAESTLSGDIKLISADKSCEVGALTYSLSVKEDLLKALKAHKKQSVARSLLVEEHDSATGETNELISTVHRCQGLNLLTADKKAPSSYVIYELFDFEPVASKTIYNNANPEYSAVNAFKVPLSESIHNYLKSTELTISVVQVDSSQRLVPSTSKPNVIGRISVPLFLLARNQSITGTFSLTGTDGNISSATIDISIRWRFDYKYAMVETIPSLPEVRGSSSLSSESNEEGEELLKRLEEEQKRKPLRVAVVSDSSSDEDDYEKRSPIHTKKLNDIKQPSTQSMESEENSSSTIISNAVKKEPTPTLMNYRNTTDDDEDFAPTVRMPQHEESPPTTAADENKEEYANEELEVISAAHSSLASQQKSGSKDEGPEEDNAEQEGSENDLTENVESLPEEEIVAAPPRSFIADLPSLTGGPPVPAPRSRAVEFTDPLHRSIPPSENSSYSENETPRKRRMAMLNALATQPASGVLKATERLDESTSDDEQHVDAVVGMRIGRLSLVEGSILVHPQYDGLNIFVEWKFLDFPQEDCETPNSLPLPRNQRFSSNFDFVKEYGLNKRRISLLRQWIELVIRLEFSLVTDGGDDGECDELGVAQLDLREVAGQNFHRIEFLNVDGIPIAEIEVEITYSKILLEYFNV